MKIGDRVFVHGYVDEIRKDTVIIRNKGGYFGTDKSELIMGANDLRGEWIPVNEKLPEEDVDVFITYRYRDGEGDTRHRYVDITSYGDVYFGGHKIGEEKRWRQPFTYFNENYKVIAWMPMPTPWEGEEDE